MIEMVAGLSTNWTQAVVGRVPESAIFYREGRSSNAFTNWTQVLVFTIYFQKNNASTCFLFFLPIKEHGKEKEWSQST